MQCCNVQRKNVSDKLNVVIIFFLQIKALDEKEGMIRKIVRWIKTIRS